MPVELWPVMQHRMAHYRAQRGSGASSQTTTSWSAACSPRCASWGPRPHATWTMGCHAPRSTGAGTGRGPARCWTSST
ncbi:MAG: hypothetical protein R2734_05375 [Nocardioides sp.]